MDRFIAKFIKNLFAPHDYLKSNMDRFIDLNSKTSSNVK